MTWSEAEYVDHLQAERRRYAWAMARHGNMTPTEAWTEALARYPYEPSNTPNRGLILHDEAWHWAMLTIHGNRYPVERPDLLQPSAEYLALE